MNIDLDPQTFLQELIDGLNHEVATGIESVQDWLEGQIHNAAVTLLHGMLPALVKTSTTVVKATESASVNAASGLVGFTLGTVDLSNTVLAGAVADKVAEGIDDLRSSSGYARGVDSIAW
jgi:sulfite exporter TauE/SafE